MADVVDCPVCGRNLRLPEGILTQKAQCPACGNTFDLPAASEIVFPSAPTQQTHDSVAVETDGPGDVTPAQQSPENSTAEKLADVDISSKNCPVCGEVIIRRANYCPYCGEDLQDEDGRERHFLGVRRDSEPHRGNLILTLGIISLVSVAVCAPVGLPFGIAAWVMAQGDLKKMDNDLMDPRGREKTKSGWVCALVGTIITGIYTLGCIAYAGVVLVLTVR